MKELKNLEKKIKGYGYDSLCLRYRLTREAQAKAEFIENRREGDHHEFSHYMAMAKRDCVRFYQILDDLIGEHD